MGNQEKLASVVLPDEIWKLLMEAEDNHLTFRQEHCLVEMRVISRVEGEVPKDLKSRHLISIKKPDAFPSSSELPAADGSYIPPKITKTRPSPNIPPRRPKKEDPLRETGVLGLEDILLETNTTEPFQFSVEDNILEKVSAGKATGVLGPDDLIKATGVLGPEDLIKHTGELGPNDLVKETGVLGPEDLMKETGVLGPDDLMEVEEDEPAEEPAKTEASTGGDSLFGDVEVTSLRNVQRQMELASTSPDVEEPLFPTLSSVAPPDSEQEVDTLEKATEEVKVPLTPSAFQNKSEDHKATVQLKAPVLDDGDADDLVFDEPITLPSRSDLPAVSGSKPPEDSVSLANVGNEITELPELELIDTDAKETIRNPITPPTLKIPPPPVGAPEKAKSSKLVPPVPFKSSPPPPPGALKADKKETSGDADTPKEKKSSLVPPAPFKFSPPAAPEVDLIPAEPEPELAPELVPPAPFKSDLPSVVLSPELTMPEPKEATKPIPPAPFQSEPPQEVEKATVETKKAPPAAPKSKPKPAMEKLAVEQALFDKLDVGRKGPAKALWNNDLIPGISVYQNGQVTLRSQDEEELIKGLLIFIIKNEEYMIFDGKSQLYVAPELTKNQTITMRLPK